MPSFIPSGARALLLIEPSRVKAQNPLPPEEIKI